MYCGETAGQIETNPIFAPVLRTWIGYTVLTVVRTPPRGLNRVRTQEYGLVPVYKQMPAKFCPTAAKGRIATWGGALSGRLTSYRPRSVPHCVIDGLEIPRIESKKGNLS